MPYRYATALEDYSDLSNGRVLTAAPGQPVLPIRLSSEIFLRVQAIRKRRGHTHPAVIYDPCCGSAYHLTALSFRHWPAISQITVSDIDDHILKTAEQNLALLTRDGMTRRQDKIANLYKSYGKPSHREAANSAARLSQQLDQNLSKHPIRTQTFAADATIASNLVDQLPQQPLDLIFTDVPYGNKTQWQSAQDHEDFLFALLESLRTVATPNTILAITTDKKQKAGHPAFEQLEQFQIGKRKVKLLKKLSLRNE